MGRRHLNILFALIFSATGLQAQTIAEKKAAVTTGYSDLDANMQSFLRGVNKELRASEKQLKSLYEMAQELYRKKAPDDAYRKLLAQIQVVKEKNRRLRESWREMVVESGLKDDDYALFHQPATTLEELVIDYGSQDYVYIIPPEIGSIQLSVSSNIPVPRSSWSEILELILSENGVGIEEISPLVRRLYALENDRSGSKRITSQMEDLEIYPDHTRITYVLTPPPTELKRTIAFLEKFVNPKTTQLEVVGRDILLVGDVITVKELLRVYQFIADNRGDLEYKAVGLRRTDPEEMGKILTAMFGYLSDEEIIDPNTKKSSTKKTETGGSLRVIPLTNIASAVFLVGTTQEIRKAEQIIQDVENQVGEAREKVLYRYKVRHSDPEELADVLERVYNMMVAEGIGIKKQRELDEEEKKRQDQEAFAQQIIEKVTEPKIYIPDNTRFYEENFYEQGGYVINPRPIEPRRREEREPNKNRKNFIVDLKSSSIVMVVEADRLDKLKDLMKKLDVPKRMVQIEVMLFEKKYNRSLEYGLNLLKLGCQSSQTHCNDVSWDDGTSIPGSATALGQPFLSGCNGVLQFFLSRTKISRGIPGFDIAYRFLMSQDDVSVNSAPTVVAVNQTEARIAIKQEESIKTGTFLPETTGGTVIKDAFTRAQYGIDILVTPTIHMHDEEDPYGDPVDYVTLDSQILFDTRLAGVDPQQPNVNRREITNVVRIPDGQSVIIGGLRDKTNDDCKNSIPFLGEIPGIGKLFSYTSLEDKNTEMFVFMTPKIISEPTDDFARIRRTELCRRPGDVPEFLCHLDRALECEKSRLFEGTMTMLFGRRLGRCIPTEGQYHGW